MNNLSTRCKLSNVEVEFWQKYYQDNYGIKADLSELEVPAPMDYPTRLIVSTRRFPIIATE